MTSALQKRYAVAQRPPSDQEQQQSRLRQMKKECGNRLVCLTIPCAVKSTKMDRITDQQGRKEPSSAAPRHRASRLLLLLGQSMGLSASKQQELQRLPAPVHLVNSRWPGSVVRLTVQDIVVAGCVGWSRRPRESADGGCCVRRRGGRRGSRCASLPESLLSLHDSKVHLAFLPFISSQSPRSS